MTVEADSEKSHEMIREMEHLSCEDKLKDLGLFILEKRLWGDLTVVFQYLKGAYTNEGEGLLF